ncbi:hypothetical protein [Micromonospora chersina]|uniref:hypothetical protein n=1 Tax=Micromonospora chersina TaxID=47854 RepID=UPI00371A03E3
MWSAATFDGAASSGLLAALLRAARERGLPAYPGEPMLAYQIDAYLDFFGL